MCVNMLEGDWIICGGRGVVGLWHVRVICLGVILGRGIANVVANEVERVEVLDA